MKMMKMEMEMEMGDQGWQRQHRITPKSVKSKGCVDITAIIKAAVL